MQSISISSWPFIIHLLIEIPAALAFAVFPSATLSVPQPQAHAVIRQYALLLFSTNIIAAIFAFQGPKASPLCGQYQCVERKIAGALAFYHLGPLIRAICRFRHNGERRRALSRQPWLHVTAHVVCLIALVGRSLNWW